MELQFNEKKMKFTVINYDGEFIGEVSAIYEVCDHCGGKGTHVNPSIDGNGLTHEDFEREGDDFRRDYFAGVYDVTCYSCEGKRVIPVFTNSPSEEEQKVIVQYNEWLKEEEYYQA